MVRVQAVPPVASNACPGPAFDNLINPANMSVCVSSVLSAAADILSGVRQRNDERYQYDVVEVVMGVRTVSENYRRPLASEVKVDEHGVSHCLWCGSHTFIEMLCNYCPMISNVGGEVVFSEDCKWDVNLPIPHYLCGACFTEVKFPGTVKRFILTKVGSILRLLTPEEREAMYPFPVDEPVQSDG